MRFQVNNNVKKGQNVGMKMKLQLIVLVFKPRNTKACKDLSV